MAKTKSIAKEVTYAETTVAVIGSTEYTSLQLAIDNVSDTETVELIKSTTESVIVPNSKNFTLNLGNNTLTNVDGNHTITNNGTVTITGSGTVDNITHEKAALWNNGTTTLTGNTYTRSQENGQGDTDSGGNSYYTIVNHGTMTINDGTTVNQNGKFSSMVENGWYNGSQNTSGLESVLTIEGGTFTGGLNTIKNDDYGKLIINNGSFTNMAQSALLNWNDAAITNGTFTADETSQSVVINGYLTTETNMDKGSLNIQGGTYSVGTPEAKSAGVTVISLMGDTENCGTINISGGTLNGDIKIDAGTEKGGLLTILGTAVIDGQIENSKYDVVNVNGGTVKQGIVNNGLGTVNVTDGTVQGGIHNTSEGSTYISGGTIEGGVTQTLPNAVTEITGGTFSNVGESDITQFMPENTKVETDEQGNIVVSEKVNPTIEFLNFPTELQVGQTSQPYEVHTVPNDYVGQMVEVLISYNGLSRANGDFTVEYEEGEDNWLELLEDRFGPASGFPLQDTSSKLRIIPHVTGTVTTTLQVKDITTEEILCEVTSPQCTFVEEPVVTKYTVTVNGGTGSGEYEEGASVTCVATIPEGKEFDVWEVTGISGAVLGNSTLKFAMPANEVTCTATFKDSEQPEPEPTPTPENGWYYIVEETGITINGLARRFNIPVAKLMKDNGITEMRPLYIGEKILIIDDGKEKFVRQTNYWI